MEKSTTSRSRAWLAALLVLLLGMAAACSGAEGQAEAAGGDRPGGEEATTDATADDVGSPAEGGAPAEDGTQAEGPDAAAVPATPQSAIPILRIGWSNPNIVGSAAPYVAQDQGFFAEVGIEGFELTETNDYVAGLLSGSFDVVQGDTDVLLQAAIQGDTGVTITAARLVREQSFLGVREGIEDVEGLRGATVTGGTPGQRNDYLVRETLTQLGLEPGVDVTVQPVNAPSNAWLEAILNGQMDGAILFERHRAPLEGAGGTALTEVIKDLPVDGFAQTEEWLEDNEETMAAFLHAIIRAQRFMKDPANAAEVARILEENGIGLDDSYEDLYVANTRNISVDLGFDPASLDQLVEEFAAIDLLPADLQWQDHVDLDALHVAQAALDLPLNPSEDLSSGANNRQ